MRDKGRLHPAELDKLGSRLDGTADGSRSVGRDSPECVDLTLAGWSHRRHQRAPSDDGRLCLNHLDQARLQTTRSRGAVPRLEITRTAPAIDVYRWEDFVFHDDMAQAPIRAPVAV